MPRHRIPKQMRNLPAAPALTKHFARFYTFRLYGIYMHISRIIWYRNNVNSRCSFRCLLFSVCSFSFPLAVCRLLFNVRRSTFTVWCLRSAALNVNCAPTGRRCARRRASIAFGGMKAEGERDLRKRSKAPQKFTALPDELLFYAHNGNFSAAQLSEQLSCCVRCPVEGASAYFFFLLLPPATIENALKKRLIR